MSLDRAYEIYECWRRKESFAAAGRELGICREHARQYSRKIERILAGHWDRGQSAWKNGHTTSVPPKDEQERIAAWPKRMQHAATQAWREGWMGPQT